MAQATGSKADESSSASRGIDVTIDLIDMPDQKGATEINKLSVTPAKAGIQGFGRSAALMPACAGMTIESASQPVERACQPELPAQIALDLAAGGLGQGARPQQRDLMGHDLMLADDRLADAVDDLIDADAVALGALDFLDDDEFLRRIAIADGECRTAMPPQCRMAALHGILDVLRIVVGAADDHDLLDPAGDEQLAGRVEKAEIAGAQPFAVRLTGDTGADHRCAGF